MTGAPLVVLDACVLANFALCDTLLRLAEPPRLFEPKWSEEIIRETTRTLELKLGWPHTLTAHLEKELDAQGERRFTVTSAFLVPNPRPCAEEGRFKTVAWDGPGGPMRRIVAICIRRNYCTYIPRGDADGAAY